MTDALTPHQREVADRVLDEESGARTHLVVHLSGAHASGFASPDSDLDLKAAHIEPTEKFLGLGTPRLVANRLEVIDGVEIDYTSNEIETAIRGVLKGNGNMLERVTTAAPFRRSPELDDLRELSLAALSKRFYRHYQGFAAMQRKAVLEADAPTAKNLLYVLRTSLTGAHLLLTGECVPDLTALHEQFGFPEVDELITLKRNAEAQSLPTLSSRTEALMERAFDRLDLALTRSKLPDEPPPRSVKALDRWLVDLRRARQ